MTIRPAKRQRPFNSHEPRGRRRKESQYFPDEVRACLNTRFGWNEGADGVRPSPGAATWEGQLAWNFRARPKCSRGCARGRARSDAGLFEQTRAASSRRLRRLIGAVDSTKAFP